MSIPSITNLQGECKSTGYTIERIASEAELHRLEADWNRLSASAAQSNAFATFGWFSAWVRHYAAQARDGHFQPEVLVIRRNGAMAGIAPLVRRVTKRFGFSVRRLEFVTIHADYNQFVLSEDRAGLTAALIEFLAHTPEQWDIVDLRDLPECEDGAELVRKEVVRNGLPYRKITEEHPCPYLVLDGNAEHQITRLSGHVRRVLRKRRAQALREGAHVRIIEHPEQEPGLIETMIALEQKKHLRSEFPPFIAPHKDVFQALFDNLGPRNCLYVALLERGAEPIAFQLGFRSGDKLWDYNKAYDRAYARLAPGTLLLLVLFDWGFAHGYREYDFLRGAEEYKMVWTPNCHNRSRLLIWNSRRASRFRKFVYYDLKSTVYRLIRRNN